MDELIHQKQKLQELKEKRIAKKVGETLMPDINNSLLFLKGLIESQNTKIEKILKKLDKYQNVKKGEL